MATITLDSIRSAADKKFAPTTIDIGDRVVELVNPIRLPRKVRERLGQVGEEMRAEGADPVAVLQNALKLVAATPEDGKALVAALGDDLAVVLAAFEAYTSEQEVGEASPSES